MRYHSGQNYYGLTDLSRRLGRGVNNVHHSVGAGLLPAPSIKIGARWYYDQRAFDAIAEAYTTIDRGKAILTAEIEAARLSILQHDTEHTSH